MCLCIHLHFFSLTSLSLPFHFPFDFCAPAQKSKGKRKRSQFLSPARKYQEKICLFQLGHYHHDCHGIHAGPEHDRWKVNDRRKIHDLWFEILRFWLQMDDAWRHCLQIWIEKEKLKYGCQHKEKISWAQWLIIGHTIFPGPRQCHSLSLSLSF